MDSHFVDSNFIKSVEVQLPVGRPRSVPFRYDLIYKDWRSDAVVAVCRGSGKIVYPTAIILSQSEISRPRIALAPKHLSNFRDLSPRVMGWVDRPDIGWRGEIAPSADRANWDPDAVASWPAYRPGAIVRGVGPTEAPPTSLLNSGRAVEVLDEEDAAYQQGLRDGAKRSIADIATLRTELSLVMAHAAISRSDLRIEAVVHAQTVLDDLREAVQEYEKRLRSEGADEALSAVREKVTAQAYTHDCWDGDHFIARTDNLLNLEEVLHILEGIRI